MKSPSKEARQALKDFKEEMAKELNISFANENHLTQEAVTTHEAAQDAAKITNRAMRNLFESSCGGTCEKEKEQK